MVNMFQNGFKQSKRLKTVNNSQQRSQLVIKVKNDPKH